MKRGEGGEESGRRWRRGSVAGKCWSDKQIDLDLRENP